MENKINYEIKAFPYEESYNYRGMDLRDYFAAKVMPVYLERWGVSEGFSKLETCELVAGWSYAMADAMMEARKK